MKEFPVIVMGVMAKADPASASVVASVLEDLMMLMLMYASKCSLENVVMTSRQ